jgi:hypothetical protein
MSLLPPTDLTEPEMVKCPEAQRLQTHPGLGALTALAFVLIIGRADRFQCGKQIASYLGLVPLEDSSGQRRRLTSAPTSKAAADNSGRIYVYSTKSAKLLWKADGHANDQLGTGLEAAGDTDGDGIPDVVASAPGAGYANIYSGRDGGVLRTLKAENINDDFGRHVAGVFPKVGDDGHVAYEIILASEVFLRQRHGARLFRNSICSIIVRG